MQQVAVALWIKLLLQMIVRVKQEHVVQKRRILLLPLHLVVADIPIVPVVHAVVAVILDRALVAKTVVVLVYAAAQACKVAQPKVVTVRGTPRANELLILILLHPQSIRCIGW